MKQAAWAMLWLFAPAAFTPGALVQADPMRPLLAPPAQAPTASATGAGADTGLANAAPTAPVVRQLQAIRQNSSGERAALFGDRWLRVGDQYTSPDGDTVVRAIGAHHVELAQGKLTYTHHLLAPLLPPQWPVRPAARPATRPTDHAAALNGAADAPKATTPHAAAAAGPAITPAPKAAPSSATATRTERQ